MSLACQVCGYEFEHHEVEDAEEARKAGLTPMFAEYTEIEHEVLGVGGQTSYVCSPECMAQHLEENYGSALRDLGLHPEQGAE